MEFIYYLPFILMFFFAIGAMIWSHLESKGRKRASHR